MSDYADRPPLPDEDAAPGWVSIPFVVLTALVCGVGLVLMVLWVATFDWWYFSGVAFLLAGFLMMMNRRAGLDRAE
ncbi:MAG: hypothetical protein ACREC5_05405 [Thermoplasmata archaeon]